MMKRIHVTDAEPSVGWERVSTDSPLSQLDDADEVLVSLNSENAFLALYHLYRGALAGGRVPTLSVDHEEAYPFGGALVGALLVMSSVGALAASAAVLDVPTAIRAVEALTNANDLLHRMDDALNSDISVLLN